MDPNIQRLDRERIETIMTFCRHIAASARITAACLCGNYLSGIPASKAVTHVLLIIHDFVPRLMNYAKVLDDTALSVLAVDEWVFERDIEKGFLGEALSSELIFPYLPLVDGKYLYCQEVRLKRRLVLELLESLVLDFPELSPSFHIEPEYFMHEAMFVRARLYPPAMYAMMDFAEKNSSKEKVAGVLRGYVEAIEELRRDEKVSYSNGYVRILPDFVARARKRRVRFTNLFRTGQRTIFASLIGIFPQVLDFFSQNRQLSTNVNLRRLIGTNARTNHRIEDPESHVYVPTSTGLVPLANRMDIETFARRILGAGRNADISIKNIGGILNDVFLVSVHLRGQTDKVIVKRFRDWSNFKWFPLTLWSVGTRTFTVSGRSRLEKEVMASQFLNSKGFYVPKLLYVSSPKRLVFMEYVEGESLERIVQTIVRSENKKELEECVRIFEGVGELIAHVHACGMVLGDTKPENIIVGKDSSLWMLDLEQADRHGDKSWDIAEFVYYAGHYLSPFVDIRRVEKMGKAFLGGYLKGGGDSRTLISAGGPKYTKVFSVFTFPHIMLVLSNICKVVGTQGKR